MSSIEARLQRVEIAMADDRDKVEEIDQRLDGLEGGHEEFHGEMQGALNSLAESWKAQLDALKDSLRAEIAAIREELKEVKGDWSLCKMAVTQGQSAEGGPKPSYSSYNKSNKDRRSGDKPKLACFLCDGNHFARDCPKRAKLSALIQDEEEEPHDEETKMGSLRLLNAIKAKVDLAKITKKGRMYVEAKKFEPWLPKAEKSWPLQTNAEKMREIAQRFEPWLPIAEEMSAIAEKIEPWPGKCVPWLPIA
ncbi:hypothetical protein Acr_07g0016220 [Actinidia rufa]|uniref:Uncharacterized protein n=1 Tax=Actinidia rufa TaxID=165716 RepID=A0A7J0EZ10_9ERIC|nr:hypothetical protein Acr_07g0016220 [Actinidia rufa]